MKYYSDTITGNRTRDRDEIPSNVWGGIVSTINSLIASGAFGKSFPECCPEGTAIYATNEKAFGLALNSEIPDIEFPFVTKKWEDDSGSYEEVPYVPPYLAVLDAVQFCYEHVAKPIIARNHDYYSHYHLSFDVEEGKDEFRSKINRIFSRNNISYELQEDGNIIRHAPEILGEALSSSRFHTSDDVLNQMLEDARSKFLHPDEKIRRESLERLWDAWERIKTLLSPYDKKKSIGLLLDKCADESQFRALLETEALSLTKLGNTFHIRHSEVGQIEIQRSTQVDYVFHRLFSFILLAIKSLSQTDS